MSDDAQEVNAGTEMEVVSMAGDLAHLMALVDRRETLKNLQASTVAQSQQLLDQLAAVRQELADVEHDIVEVSKDAKAFVESLVPPPTRIRLPMKWKHPGDPSKQWSGKGKRPTWAVGIELVAV